MKATRAKTPDTVILTLRGDFDRFVVQPFLEEIALIGDEGISRVVLNMRLVKFVNSSALGAMIRARKDLKTAGGDLVVSQPSCAVVEAMEALGVQQLFDIRENDGRALASVA